MFFYIVLGAFEFLLLYTIFCLRWIFNKKSKTLLISYILFFILSNVVLYYGLQRTNISFTIFIFYLNLLWLYFLATFTVFILYKVTRSKYPTLFRSLMPLAFFGLVAFSWYNAQVPVIHEYRVKLDKPLSKPLKVLVASDLHLDYLVGNRAIQKLVEVNKKVQPDIILMPGDIINNDASVYYKYNMQEDMKKLTAPLGVYASLGNHEFYGLLAENIQAIKDGNIILLRDQAIVINNEFILVGREDQTNPERLPLEQILAKQNPKLPILVMDHRPYFDEVIASKVDLQVSGHTHRGQLFPLNLVVSFMYDLSYGYKQVEASHLFTTSGWGFWGAPFRLGSQREVFVITLEGSN